MTNNKAKTKQQATASIPKCTGSPVHYFVQVGEDPGNKPRFICRNCGLEKELAK